MTRDRVYVVHILECIARIEEYTQTGKGDFDTDARTQNAVVHNLQVLAEPARRLSEAITIQHPSVDWRSIIAFRNVAVHDYLGIDLNQIWDIIERNLPELKAQMKVVLQGLDQI